jgi:ribonuclease HII
MRAGIDEVGLGAVAGPAVVAVVVIKPDAVQGLRDSKMLSEDSRTNFEKLIRKEAEFIWHAQREIDFIAKYGLAKAWLACMQECVHHVMLHYQNIEIVADNPPGRWSLRGLEAVRFLPNGDDTVPEIQAASIIAKTHRDRIMCRLAEKHPVYGFETNKGYPTPTHVEALKKHGPSPVHRPSWKTTAEREDRPTETAFDRVKAEAAIAEITPFLSDIHIASEWERNFVGEMTKRLKVSDLSPKQMYYLLRAQYKIKGRARKLRGAKS